MSSRIAVLLLLALAASLPLLPAVASAAALTPPLAASHTLSGTAEPSADAAIAFVTPAREPAGAGRRVTLHVLPPDGSAAAVSLVGPADGAALGRWTLPRSAPGTIQTVRWRAAPPNGKTSAGRYAFWIVPTTTVVGVVLQTGRPVEADFQVMRDVFPILGPHAYSMTDGRFGDLRAGHAHAGQDTFAACGTPLVAARSGVVRERKYEGAAGNYLVIDVGDRGQADVYDHLKAPATVKVGQRVTAGDPIGRVGETGDAEGCHLHFEMWTAPGWFAGGKPHDPLPFLRKLDPQKFKVQP